MTIRHCVIFAIILQCPLIGEEKSTLINKPSLGLFAIIMITITSVDSLRNLPATALFGAPLIVFFLIAGLFFLTPSAMVASELSAMLPKTGGVYVWVREAFGKKWGFLAIWFQWIENVVWYPTILSFIAGTGAYLIAPELAQDKIYLFVLINVIFWGLTLINLLGIKSSARFSEFCGIVGLLLPMGLIIFLGIHWIWTEQPLQISFTAQHLLPSFKDPSLLVSLTAVILTFSGMEIATAHGQDVKNPKRTYPLALIVSVLIIFSTMLLGAISIAIIVPKDDLSLVAGIMQAFNDFFKVYHLTWLTPIIACCIIIGSLGGISNWIMAPSRGLQVALKETELASFLQGENKRHAPTRLLLFQAVLVSLITSLFLFMPNVNSSYWIITVLASQLYMIMYIIMFAAGIYLRYKGAHLERPFKIPGPRNSGMWIVAGVGLLISAFIIVIGFFPPADIDVGNVVTYELLLIGGLILMSAPPFVLYWLQNNRLLPIAIGEV